MKKIYAIRGVQKTGKSESIKMFYNKLKAKYTNLEISDKYTPIYDGDISVVVEINGKIIAIESQGDPNSRILDSLPKFAAIPANIIICATRTRGSTVDVVKQQQENYQITWIDKKESTNVDKGNKEKNREANNKVADDLMLRLEGDL